MSHAGLELDSRVPGTYSTLCGQGRAWPSIQLARSHSYRLPCRGAVYTRNWYGHELAEPELVRTLYIRTCVRRA